MLPKENTWKKYIKLTKTYDLVFIMKFLEILRKSGIVNMFGAGPFLYGGKKYIENEIKRYKDNSSFWSNSEDDEDEDYDSEKEEIYQELIDMADSIKDKMIQGAIGSLKNQDDENFIRNVQRKIQKDATEILMVWSDLKGKVMKESFINEEIVRIKEIMGIQTKNLLTEGVDPRKITSLFYEFINGTDATRVTTLNKIRLLNTDEKKIFDDFIAKNSEFIKSNSRLTSVDDLARIATVTELAKFARELASKSNQISKMLSDFNIDFSKYYTLSLWSNPKIESYDKIVKDTLSKDPQVKKMLDSIHNKKYSEINFDDLQITTLKVFGAVQSSTSNPELNKAFTKLYNDLYEVSTDMTNIKFMENLEKSKLNPDLKPKQVTGIRINEVEYDNMQKIIDEKGMDKNWGWDSVNDTPLSEKVKVNNQDVEFSVTNKGPRTADWDQISKDDLFTKHYNEFNQANMSESLTWPQFFYRLYKNDPTKLDLYLPHYKVLGGVKISSESTIDGKNWLIVNPSEATKGMKKGFNWVLNHEMAHVNQPSLGILWGKNQYIMPNYFTDPNDAVNFLFTNKKTKYELNWDKFKEQDYADDVIDEWSRLNNGKDPLNNRPDYENFMNWAKKNDKIPWDLFDSYETNITNVNNFGKNTKKRSFDTILDEYLKTPNLSKEKYEKINRFKKITENFNENQLLTFLKNNINDVDLKNIILRMSDDLGYTLNKAEMEAEYAALIREIIELGTDKENEGFVTWMIDWLRNSNKLENLTPGSKEKTFIESFKNFIYNTSKNKKYSEANNPYFDKVSWFFNNFFNLVESKYKKVYPEDAQKLYKGLYKQLYELISKGYPILLPFVLVGANELTSDEPIQQNTNENRIIKLKLFEIFKNNIKKNNSEINYLLRRFTEKDLETSFTKTKVWITKNFRKLPYESFKKSFVIDMINNLEIIYNKNLENNDELKTNIEKMYQNKIKDLYLKLNRQKI